MNDDDDDGIAVARLVCERVWPNGGRQAQGATIDATRQDGDETSPSPKTPKPSREMKNVWFCCCLWYEYAVGYVLVLARSLSFDGTHPENEIIVFKSVFEHII